MGKERSRTITAAAFLVGLGAAWNGGNVGPIVAPLAADFDVSLGQIGLLSGSVFCAGVAAAGFTGSYLTERLTVLNGLRSCCLICLGGNLVCAASPVFGGLLAARIVIGFGLGLCFLFGGVFARAEGGSRLVGIFGAGITLGIALALAIGGALEDAGVDWRVTFAISALVGGSALPFLPRRTQAEVPAHEPAHLLFRQAATSQRFWRLQLNACAAFSVPLVIGAWLVHYLVTEGDMSPTTAGLIAFAMFGVSALSRELGGQLLARGARHGIISLSGLVTGAAGVAVLAVEPSVGGALVASALMGFGLSFSYAVVYDEGLRVIPQSPAGGLGLIQAVANTLPIPATPLLGAALAAGNGTAGWLALAAFVLAGAIANARSPVPPTAASAGPG